MDTLQNFLEDNFQFQSRKVRTEAKVFTYTECAMIIPDFLALRAGNIEFVTVVENRLIGAG